MANEIVLKDSVPAEIAERIFAKVLAANPAVTEPGKRTWHSTSPLVAKPQRTWHSTSYS